jgi:hypothetical protein
MPRRPRDDSNEFYDVNIINDLHNHFPALLYNIDQFHSVRDLLQYVRARVASRYDHFTIAQRNYNSIMRGRGFAATGVQQEAGAAGRARSAARLAGRRSRILREAIPPINPAGTAAPAGAPAPLRTDHYQAINTRFPTINTPLGGALFPGTNIFNLPPFQPQQLQFPTTGFTFDLPTLTYPVIETTQADMADVNALLALLGLMTTPQVLEPVIIRPSNEVIEQTTALETVTATPVPGGICVICQEEFAVGNTIRKITQCGHTFHNDCIMQHFESSVRCPTCRFDIRDTEIDAPANAAADADTQ